MQPVSYDLTINLSACPTYATFLDAQNAAAATAGVVHTLITLGGSTYIQVGDQQQFAIRTYIVLPAGFFMNFMPITAVQHV